MGQDGTGQDGTGQDGISCFLSLSLTVKTILVFFFTEYLVAHPRGSE